jgi:hypothetical protein
MNNSTELHTTIIANYMPLTVLFCIFVYLSLGRAKFVTGLWDVKFVRK